MTSVLLNRDGTELQVVRRNLGVRAAYPQFIVRFGATYPALGTGNEVNYIGEFVGRLTFGADGIFDVEYDWITGAVMLITGRDVTISARRDNANGASPLTIAVTADVVENVEGENIDPRTLVIPQRTQILAATGQGTALPIGTVPPFARRIIGVYGTLVAAGEFELRLERNDDTLVAGAVPFAANTAFGAVSIPLPIDCTRVIGAETNNGAGDDVTNIRVVYELSLP